ncbi:MAG: radical SAM protein [Chloroflexota bacterium]|nr:radical SAM protein [Chloroflexota bacterium]
MRFSKDILDTEAIDRVQLAQAWHIRQANFPPLIGFDYPVDTAEISLTGPYCALNCAHCGRRYLEHMIPIWEASERIDQAPSLLISGGCDGQGRVPVGERALRLLHELHPGRRFTWHVGLIDQEGLEPIIPLVDVISFDFVGDDETIREVTGLDRSVADYVATYQLLQQHVPVIPHLVIGLRGGELGHERKALDLLAELGCEALVFLVLIPTPGTRYADRQPPAVVDVIHLLVEARLRFPRTPLILGCMRPHGPYRRVLDPLALRAGLNRIVNPAHGAVKLAQELGLGIRRGNECCVLDMDSFQPDARLVDVVT